MSRESWWVELTSVPSVQAERTIWSTKEEAAKHQAELRKRGFVARVVRVTDNRKEG